jgi:hypothetical protein
LTSCFRFVNLFDPIMVSSIGVQEYGLRLPSTRFTWLPML